MDTTGTEIVVHSEHAAETWSLLAGQVQAFIHAWEIDPQPPDVAAFAIAGEGPAAPRRLLLIELIKVDLDYRWGRGREPRKVEDYLAAFPEIGRDGPPCDLIYEEYRVRLRAGDRVEAKDYLARFPNRAAELGRLLGLDLPQTSASLIGGRGLDSVQAGQTIDDFDLLALLGKGAFARVFLARQRSMQRLVALKVSAECGQEPQTLAQLDHPHIVRVFDQRPVPGRGLHLLYMQYVPGGALLAVLDRIRRDPAAPRGGRTLLDAVDQALAQRGESPPIGSALRERMAAWDWPETVCWLGARLAEALDHAHRRGVLHRDVKPANVLLTAEGAPRLADFNVSFGSKLEGANPAAFFGGSLSYMSPEQLEAFNPAHPRPAGDLDGRSDLYALCLVLWELLAGRGPFREAGLARDWSAMLARMTERRRVGLDPAEAAALPSGRPVGLGEVLLAGLSPDPDKRPESGAALARELELCLQPRARRLLHPPIRGWRASVRRSALFVLLLATILPNAVGALCNIAYNRSQIIANLPGAEPERVFWIVQGFINSVAFPLGIVVLAVLAWPVVAAVRGVDRGGRGGVTPPLPGAGLWTRPPRRCYVLGDLAAGLGVVEWTLAGVVFPTCLCVFLGPQPPAFFLHFFVSLVLCGLIAAVHPFFWVTFLAVRVLLPPLIRRHGLAADDLARLEGLRRRIGLYLLLSATAPMLSVAAMAAMGSDSRAGLGVLSLVGLIGFGVAFALARAVQGDLEALAGTAGAASPAQEAGSSAVSTMSPKAPPGTAPASYSSARDTPGSSMTKSTP